MKKVSIIVPVHNSEKYIEQCIDSILGQTYSCFELIVIDDNSTDSSHDILEKIKSRDDRIILKHVCAGSAGKARNYGLEEATGFYLAFIDSDDWVEPTYLEDLISEIENNDCDCAMCGTTRHYPNGTIENRAMSDGKTIIYGEEMRNGTLMSILPNHQRYVTFYLWDKIYKRSLWKNVVFDSELRNGEDRVALYEVFNDDVRTAVTTKHLYNYRAFIGITSKKSELSVHNDYDVGYRVLKIAKENGYDLSSVYQTIVCHTLGKARMLMTNRAVKEYFELVHEFREIYPKCKNVISIARTKFKILIGIFHYFPGIMYSGYGLLSRIKSFFGREK